MVPRLPKQAAAGSLLSADDGFAELDLLPADIQQRGDVVWVTGSIIDAGSRDALPRRVTRRVTVVLTTRESRSSVISAECRARSVW